MGRNHARTIGVLVATALAFAVCGDDDDSGDADGSTEPTEVAASVAAEPEATEGGRRRHHGAIRRDE